MIAMQTFNPGAYTCADCYQTTSSVVALDDVHKTMVCFDCWLKMADLIREKKND